MSALPSISDSAMSALQGGFALLDKGAEEAVSGSLGADVPRDMVNVRSQGTVTEMEPMLAGVRDMMLARIQVGAGAALLHAYSEDRRTLYEMLRD